MPDNLILPKGMQWRMEAVEEALRGVIVDMVEGVDDVNDVDAYAVAHAAARAYRAAFFDAYAVDGSSCTPGDRERQGRDAIVGQ